jgi:hypothetical protein
MSADRAGLHALRRALQRRAAEALLIQRMHLPLSPKLDPFVQGSRMTTRHRIPAWRAVALAAALCVASLDALADDQANRVKALEQRLERSLKLIEQLSNRVSELEQRTKPEASVAAVARPASAPAASDGVAPAIAALQDEVNQINEGLSQRGFDFGLPVHGFADVQAASSSSADPLHLKGFNAGTLDLYLTPQFGDRVRALAEIAIEYDPAGKSTQIDMERLQLGYTVSDTLTFWMGRFHTPFGQWNTSFHHGANLQTSIYRPRFIEFEDRGGIIPAHSVGFWATGKTTLGPGKITYDAYVANGPSVRNQELDFNPFTDDSPGKMVGLNLGYQPSGLLRGLTAGVHGFTSKVGVYAPPSVLFVQSELRMAGVYAAYDANDWEVFSEYYRFSNSDIGGNRRHISNAGFVHVGRIFGQLTPYVRYERASLDPSDVYFTSQRTGRSYTRYVAGSRYALDARSSVKLEFSRSDEAGVDQLDEAAGIVFTPRANYNRAAFQYSIAF